jgi:transposase
MLCKKGIGVVRTIGIDTGKNTLHMIGLDGKGTIVLCEKASRSRIAARLVNVPPCLIGIEAGIATHYVSRELLTLGQTGAAGLFQAVSARPQERFPRRSCGRRSRATPFDALCSN